MDKVKGRKHFICPICKNGSGRGHNDSWVLDVKNGGIVDRKTGAEVYTQFAGDDEYLLAVKDSLQGAEVCGSCVESVREYGSRILVFEPGDGETASFFAYGDEDLVWIDRDGGDCATYAQWAVAVAKATTYHRTDAWRGYHDTPDEINIDGGKLTRVDDNTLLAMGNENEVKDVHVKLQDICTKANVPLVMVVHLTSNVFSTIVQHYLTDDALAKTGLDEKEDLTAAQDTADSTTTKVLVDNVLLPATDTAALADVLRKGIAAIDAKYKTQLEGAE